MICFYHSADLDGHCSGAIVKYKYPDCEMIGINYGDEFPWDRIKNQDIIMVDFSLQPFELMDRLFRTVKSLIWIEHHKTSVDDFDSYIKGDTERLLHLPVDRIKWRLDTEKAACELAWEYFYPNDEMPLSVKLLGRYDVWDHSDKATLPFQWGMRQFKDTYPDNQLFWKDVFFNDTRMEVIYTDGTIICDYRDSENAKYIKGFAFETEFERFKFICINRGMTNSQMFDSIWDPNKYDGMLTFVRKGGQWTVSLYTTKDELDFTPIAKKYGGGGHPHACGFQCDELPFKY